MTRVQRAVTLVVAAVLCAAWVGVGTAQPAPGGLRDVRDPGGRFSIGAPADWEVQANAGGSPSVILAAPSPPGEFRLNINVVAQTLRTPLSSEAFGRGSESGLRASFHAYTIVQEGRAEIGGRAAYYRYFTAEPTTGISVYVVQVYFTAGQTAFVVTGSTANDPDRLRTDLPVIARIIDSFRVAESPGGPTT